MRDPPIDVDREALEDFCERHEIRRLSWFGSVLREDFGPESDVDLLVEFEDSAEIGLIGLAGLENELSEMIGREVDLRTPGELSPHFRDDVLSSAVEAYASA